MSSIPGPILVFRIDASAVSQLNTATQTAFNQVRAQSKAAADAAVADWQRMSAQLRASIGQNALSVSQVADAHKRIVATIDTQLTLLRQKDTLTKRELADLKAMTLERERQTDAIKRGQNVGVTLGTQSALGQVSFQTTQGIERIVDSLVNRYLGGAAGAFTRTIRDISYYGGVGGASTGTAGGGVFGSLAAGFKTFTSAIPGAALAIGGLVAAEASLVAVGASVTKSMVGQAQAINTVAATTGLTTTQVQEYTHLAEEMGGGASNLVAVFARLQGQLGEYLISGKSADESTQKFVKALTEMGISITDSGNKLRPINDILEDLGARLQSIPDVATRNAYAFAALGPRGRELVEIFNQASLQGKTLKQALDDIARSGDIIPQSQIDNLQKVKNQFDEFGRSVHAQWLTIKEDIASVFLQLTHIQDVLPKGNLQGQAQQQAIAELRSNRTPLNTSLSLFIGTPQENAALLERANIIKLGGKAQADLAEAEKKYAEAIKENQGAEALKYAQEISSLREALALDKQRLNLLKERQRLFDEFSKNYGGRPNERGQSHERILNNLVNPLTAPNITTGNPATDFLASAGIPVPIGPGPAITAPKNPIDLLNQITDEFNSAYKTQQQIDREHFDELRSSLNDYLQGGLISWQEYYKSIEQIQATESKTMEEFQKRFNQEAGSLFDELLSGNARGFAKSLQKDLEDIALKPIKTLFENQLGSLFAGLDNAINHTGTGGGINLGGIGTATTPPFFGGPSGINISRIPGLGGLGGQRQFATQTMLVSAGSVTIGGAGIGGGATSTTAGIGGAIAQFGSFLGNNNPVSTTASAGPVTDFLNSIGLGSTTVARPGGSFFSNLSPFLGAGGLIGAAIAGHSIGGAISGASALGTAGLGALSKAGIISKGLGKTLGGVFGGAGLLASGIEQGGVAGGLQDLAGGAEIGTAILPGIGTAVGAIGGAITGIIRGLFGESYANKVKDYIQYHNYVAPPSETFQFASNGSIRSTLGTGFAQSGNLFSSFALPSNTPFTASAYTGQLTGAQLALLLQQGSIASANAFGTVLDPTQGGRVATTNRAFGTPSPSGLTPQINIHFNLPGYVDASSAAQALEPAMTHIIQRVTSSFRQSSSGWGSGVRAAAYLP